MRRRPSMRRAAGEVAQSTLTRLETQLQNTEFDALNESSGLRAINASSQCTFERRLIDGDLLQCLQIERLRLARRLPPGLTNRVEVRVL
jgi:hypothetical protein